MPQIARPCSSRGVGHSLEHGHWAGTWGVLCHGTQELLLLLPALV